MAQSPSIYEVFTPTTQARVNFVPRAAANDSLVNALRTPGTQIVVYGESGSGKSTLLQQKLRELYPDHITTRCHTKITFEQVLLDAFDKLAPYFAAKLSAGSSAGLTAKLEAPFKAIRSSIEVSASSSSSIEDQRWLPPQLTPQRLGELLGASEVCWVLEDFHKVSNEEKPGLSQVLKLFCDLSAEYPALKIVAVGATDTARDVVDWDSEMAERVAEIKVDLMTPDEVEQILRGGEELIGLDFGVTRGQIVDYASGVASICHQLALSMCQEADINEPLANPHLFSNDELNQALATYIGNKSDQLKARFDAALRIKRKRKYDNCRLILGSLASAGLDGLTHAEIFEEIREQHPEYPAGNLTTYLRQLCGSERSEVLRCTAAGRFRFDDPFCHLYARLTILQKRAPGSHLSNDEAFQMVEELLSLVRGRIGRNDA